VQRNDGATDRPTAAASHKRGRADSSNADENHGPRKGEPQDPGGRPGAPETRTARRIAGRLVMNPLPVPESPHKLQSRPHLIHRRHLHVHETVRQPDARTTSSLRVRRHPGCLLGPRYHNMPAGASARREGRESAFERSLLVVKTGRSRAGPPRSPCASRSDVAALIPVTPCRA